MYGEKHSVENLESFLAMLALVTCFLPILVYRDFHKSASTLPTM